MGTSREKEGCPPPEVKPTPAERIAEGLRRIAQARSGADGDLKEFRLALSRELVKLIPEAVAQAKKGKPALLRLLARFR